MMKKLYPFLFVLATPVILLLMSNSNGSPGGRSGSTGDGGATCTQCHTGTASTVSNWITTNVPAEGYTPGQTYTITASGTHPGVVKFGFELTVENSQGAKIGTLQLTDPARTKLTNANKAVTHTAAGNVPSGNTNSWSMNWVAPAGVSGNVGIYAAFNAANGNGNTGGDVIYKSSVFISEFVPPPVLLSIAPNGAEQGETFQATITGNNTQFAGSPSVSLVYSLNGFEIITATNVIVINSTTIQADFTIPLMASSGLWDVKVNTLLLQDAFTIDLLSGIANNNFDDTKIYPNPAYQRFYIDNAVGEELSLYNSKGDLIMTTMVVNEKQEINISQLSRGLYIVKIQSDGTNRVKKLIVN